LLVVLPVLPLQIGRQEVEGHSLLDGAGVDVAHVTAMPCQRAALFRQPGKHLLASGDKGGVFRADAVYSQREEEMAFRRDQPPLAVALLGAEKAGRGKLR